MYNKVCKQCGKGFSTKKKTQIFCSRPCVAKSIDKYGHGICPHCGKKFKKNTPTKKWCSKNCEFSGGVEKNKNAPKGMKYCISCKRYIITKGFSKCKNGYQGLTSRCKFCHSLQTMANNYKIKENYLWELLEKQQWNCNICGRSLKQGFTTPEAISYKSSNLSVSLDHIIPGINTKNNYQLTHRICNASKQNRNMEELLNWCKQVITNNALNKEEEK